MNVHDSERMAGMLEAAGYVPAAGEHADVVVFNTCAVRENADNKLYGNLGMLAPVKAANPGMQIAVGGCLAQKDREAILKKAPWVDAVFGTLPLRPGGYGIARLWQTAVIELEGNASLHSNAEYVHNRSLWSTLLAVAAYLDIMDAPLPPAEALEALIAALR